MMEDTSPITLFELYFKQLRLQKEALEKENQTHFDEIQHLELLIRNQQKAIKTNQTRITATIKDQELLFKTLISKRDIYTIRQLVLEKEYSLPHLAPEWSIEHGCVECLEFAIEYRRDNMNYVFLVKHSIKYNQLECLRLLLNYTSIEKGNLTESIPDYYGDRREQRWFNQYTRCAAQYKNLDILRFLVEQGGDVEEGVLDMAVSSGCFECLEYAYHQGARFSSRLNGNFNDYGTDALEMAAKHQDPRCLIFLVEVAKCGSTLTSTQIDRVSLISTENLGKVTLIPTEVFLATSISPSVECMNYLWSLRTRINGIEFVDPTYSIKIATTGRLDIMKTIINMGASISCETMYHAARNGHLDMVHYLYYETNLLAISPHLFTEEVRNIIKLVFQTRQYKCILFFLERVYGPWNRSMYEYLKNDLDLDHPFWRWFVFDQVAIQDHRLIKSIQEKKQEIEAIKDSLNVLVQEKKVIKDIVVYNICPYI